MLPYPERHSGSKWYVPMSQKNCSTFGFGRSNIWYAGSDTQDQSEIEYVERILENIENYNGENWMNKEMF